MEMAYNTGIWWDGNPEAPTLDWMKFARPMWNTAGDEWNQDHAALVATGVLDANGWPTELPEGSSGIRFAFDRRPDLEGKRVVLTYEGTGTLVVSNVLDVAGAGTVRIEFTTKDENFWATITATDPGETGDYVRNICIRETRYETLLEEAEALEDMFNPEYLDLVGNASQLRFLTWQQINSSPEVDWADHAQVSSATWMDGSFRPTVPVQVMVALANRVGFDPWFQIPHQATDAWVTGFVTYVRDNLNPALTAHFGYSNEFWNSFFGQQGYMLSQGLLKYGSGGDEFGKGQRWGGYRAAQCMEIIRTLFGCDSGDRPDAGTCAWYGELEAWTAGAYQTGMRLAGVYDHIEEEDGSAGRAANTLFSAIAITSYFGHDYNGSAGDATIAAYRSTHTDAQTRTWLTANLLAEINGTLAGHLAEHKVYADEEGMALTLYEGGQHLHSENSGASGAFLRDYVASEDMATLYVALEEMLATFGVTTFMQYDICRAANANSSWGAFRYIGDLTPRGAYLRSRERGLPYRPGYAGGKAKAA